MSSNKWLDQDGLRLKQLRLDAGVEPDALARKIAISRKMLRQLEDGGESAFYSASIKFQTGRKLLKIFGADVSNPEPQIADADADHADFDLSKSDIHKTVDAIIQVSEKNLDKSLVRDSVATMHDVWRGHKSLVVFSAFSAIVVVGAIYKHSAFTFEETTAQAMRKKDVVEAPVSAQAMGSSSNEQPALSVASASDVLTEKNAIKESHQERVKFEDVELSRRSYELTNNNPSSHDCKWSDGGTLVTSPAPTKSDNYVYMVAMQDMTVCVMDNANVNARYELKANAERNITGVPPFRMYSQNLKSLKVFYQGHRVMSGDAAEITLQSRPIAR